MAQIVTMIAVGKWSNRETLNYVPVNTKIDGVLYNAFGMVSNSAYDQAIIRRPYRIEEDSGVTYVMYDDDTNGAVPIYRTTEV